MSYVFPFDFKEALILEHDLDDEHPHILRIMKIWKALDDSHNLYFESPGSNDFNLLFRGNNMASVDCPDDGFDTPFFEIEATEEEIKQELLAYIEYYKSFLPDEDDEEDDEIAKFEEERK